MASYPTSVKSFTAKNSGDVIQAAHIGDLQDEVNAIEAGILNGTAPLNSSKSTVATLSVTGGSTLASLDVDGNSTLASSITVGTIPYVFPSSGGSTGQVLTAVSTSGSTMGLEWRTPSGVSLLTRIVATVNVVNSTVQTDVLNYSVSSGTLSSNNAIQLDAYGTYYNNTPDPQDLTLRLVWGGSTVLTYIQTGSANADSRDWAFHARIAADSHQSSQTIHGEAWLGNTNTIGGTMSNPGATWKSAVNTSSIDSASAQTLKFTFQHSSNNSSLAARLHALYLTKIS